MKNATYFIGSYGIFNKVKRIKNVRVVPRQNQIEQTAQEDVLHKSDGGTNKKLTSIILSFEDGNPEQAEFQVNDIKFLDYAIDNNNEIIYFNIILKPTSDRVYSTHNGISENTTDTIFNRILRFNDISQIEFVYDNSISRCYYTVFESIRSITGVDNVYQKSWFENDNDDDWLAEYAPKGLHIHIDARN